MMVSPSTYDRRLVSYDQAIYNLVSRQGRKLAVHHCGSFEKYAATYRKIPALTWLEIGWGSDFRLALDLFPESFLQYILSAVYISTASRQEVREKISSILEGARGDWRRLRLSMADIEAGTPDENLYEIYECCKQAR
jgi:uroporphyrinogen-III decarboxylase